MIFIGNKGDNMLSVNEVMAVERYEKEQEIREKEKEYSQKLIEKLNSFVKKEKKCKDKNNILKRLEVLINDWQLKHS